MAFDPQAYRPESAILSLGDPFYDVVEAARTYSPDIGDGRGFTFAQLRDRAGRLMDLGTKGSGTTPWSRFGDGRLTLKGAVREVLASEMLEALNVPTSRSLSLIETGETLFREDEPSPTRAAVLVRLSHGHIRIGTFQRLAFERDAHAMRRLVRYVMRELYGENSDDPVALLTQVVERAARMTATYLAAGFVHGVLNSDNINVTGESFDYGPWRFAPSWDAGFTAAYFDEEGLYAFGRQPEAVHWNVKQLAASLRLITRADPLIQAIDGFAAAYQPAFTQAMLWRLGRRSASPDADCARFWPPRRRAPTARTIIGRARPAPCRSTRWRRSGRRSAMRTIGRRSMPRSLRSARWARRCAETCVARRMSITPVIVC